MRIIGQTNIDFMSQRKIWLTLSLVLVVISVTLLGGRGVRQGVEFAGGAELILRYLEAPSLQDVRQTLTASGLDGVTVTTSKLTAGDRVVTEESGQDLIIRVALQKEEESAAQSEEARRADLTTQVLQSLRPAEIKSQLAQGLIDLNTTDQTSLSRTFIAKASLDADEAQRVADEIVDWRRNHGGVFSSVEQVAEVIALPEQLQGSLEQMAFAGPFGLRAQEFIAASVSAEMRSKAIGAIFGALLGMLAYIWIRFQLQWGLAAIVALVHDTTLTLGAFSLAGLEANLPVVAAFLTLVGYSVNDTIVVFDRIRENLKRKASGKLVEVINLSINQNLSRTLITSLTTWLVVLALFILGGSVIRPFAFVLLIGILVGTYSSVYIASPVLLIWQRLFASRGAKSTTRAKGSRKAVGAAR